MKAKVKYFVIFLIILFFFCSAKKKNSWTDMDLNGKVKSLKQITYIAVSKFGNIEKDDIIGDYYYGSQYDFISPNYGNYFDILFDSKGNIIDKIFYESDGNLSGKMIYKYNDKGNIIKRNWYESDGSCYVA